MDTQNTKLVTVDNFTVLLVIDPSATYWEILKNKKNFTKANWVPQRIFVSQPTKCNTQLIRTITPQN